MKISLGLGPRRTLSRQTAWGCLTSNLAMPGVGSLVAGRRSGYAQLVLGVVGLVMTMVFGARFILWYSANFSRVTGGDLDPIESFAELWRAVRWAFLGITLFALGWVWSLAVGLTIVREAKNAERSRQPPKLV